MNRFALLVSLALLFSATVYAQTPAKADDEARKINEYYSRVVCDIETRITVTVDGVRDYPNSFPIRIGTIMNGDYPEDIVTIAHKLSDNEIAFSGTGFFVEERILATAAHVVKIKDDVLDMMMLVPKIKVEGYNYWITMRVNSPDGKSTEIRKFKAELLGADTNSDTALLSVHDIDSKLYSIAPIGDPDKLMISDRLYALGTPFGLSYTFTDGKVSGLHRILDFWYLEDFIQTTTPINPGNSGSPLINSAGEVVGINDLTIRGANGTAFAVSIKLLDVARLKKGDVILGWFGAEALLKNIARSGSDDDPEFDDVRKLNNETGINSLRSLERLLQLTKERFAVVKSLDATRDRDGNICPAKRAGLKRGDLITKVNGKLVSTGMEVRLAISGVDVGQNFPVEVTRVTQGKTSEMTIVVTMGDPKKRLMK